MLMDEEETVVKWALTALHNLLTYNKADVAGLIRTHGGVANMSSLMNPVHSQTWGDRFYAMLCSCLEMLCVFSIEGKSLVAHTTILKPLIGHIDNTRYQKLAYTSSRLLRTLSVYNGYKTDIIQPNVTTLMKGYVASRYYKRPVQETLLLVCNKQYHPEFGTGLKFLIQSHP